jgi:argininosuccinate lyase
VVKQTPAIEQRLKHVQELRDKGLITEQEAREIRQRILGEL